MLLPRQATGVSPAPPGVQPNYVDPPSIGYRLTVVDWVLLAPALLLTGIRVYTRIRFLRSWGWDDSCAAFALLIAIARACTNLVWVYRYKEGRDIWNVPVANFGGVRNYQEIEYMLYTAAICFVKLSIVLFMLKIFAIKKYFRYISWLSMFVIIGYSLGCFLALAFTCTPVYFSWHLPSNPEDYAKVHCINPHNIIVASGALNIVTDAAIILLPLPAVIGLALSRAKKVGIFVVFGIGIVSFVVAIVREAYVANKDSLINSTVADVQDAILLTVELQFGIMCASTPALSVLWNRALSDTRFGTSIRGLFSLLSISPSSSNRPSGRSDDNRRGAGRLGSEDAASGYDSSIHVAHAKNKVAQEDLELQSLPRHT